MAGLAVERLRVAPICQLCGGAPGVARVGKLGEDAPEVGSALVLVAGERPAFRQAGEILAAIVLAEPVELRSADRERGLEIGGGAACQLLCPRGVALIARRDQQDRRARNQDPEVARLERD